MIPSPRLDNRIGFSIEDGSDGIGMGRAFVPTAGTLPKRGGQEGYKKLQEGYRRLKEGNLKRMLRPGLVRQPRPAQAYVMRGIESG